MIPKPPPNLSVIKFAEGFGLLETFPYGEGDAFENVVVVLELHDEITLVAVATVEVGIVDEGTFGGVDGFGDGKAGGFDGGDGFVVGGEGCREGCAGASTGYQTK